VPGNVRDAQAKFVHQPGVDRDPVLGHARQRPDRAAELADEYPRFAFREALSVAAHLGQPYGDLEAERDRQGLLSVCPPDHQRVAVLACQLLQGGDQIVEGLLEQCHCFLQLEDNRRVHHVLRRRAPMHVTACLALAQFG
jgi:hypothetical protein